MADRIITLKDDDNNPTFPIAGGMMANSVTTAMLKDDSVTTAKIADGAVTSSNIDWTTLDSGWKSLVSYVNGTYFSPRATSGQHMPRYRIVNGIVYFKGEVYCSTAVGGRSGVLLSGIPSEIYPVDGYQQNGSGVLFDNGTPYMLFVGGSNGNFSVSMGQNITVQQDWQGFSLSGMAPYICAGGQFS